MLRRLAPVCLLFALISGCGPEDSFAVLHPLTGTVTRDGKPVTEGGIIFIPESGSWRGMIVNAAVQADGTFTAETSRTTGLATTIQSGAPVGTYKAVYHPPSDGQKTGLEVELPTLIVVEKKSNTVKLELPAKMPEGHGTPRDDAPKPAADGDKTDAPKPATEENK